jgi:hypothetical protein
MTGYNEYENDDGIMVGVGKCRIFSLISENHPQLNMSVNECVKVFL